MRLLVQSFAVIIVMTFSFPVLARSGSGWNMGLNFGLVNAGQEDMDKVIEQGPGGSDMGNGLEVNGSFGYSFGDISMLIRPGYYWVSEDGAGSEYSLNAFSIMPMLRWNLLSNNTIAFYTQLGLGWTMMSGEIKEAGYNVEFSGSTIGYAGGLGAEFCFIDNHCFYLEANLRVAEVARMTVDSTSGTNTNSAITQAGKGQEFEINDRDFSSSLSGIQGLIGYNLRF